MLSSRKKRGEQSSPIEMPLVDEWWSKKSDMATDWINGREEEPEGQTPGDKQEGRKKSYNAKTKESDDKREESNMCGWKAGKVVIDEPMYLVGCPRSTDERRQSQATHCEGRLVCRVREERGVDGMAIVEK